MEKSVVYSVLYLPIGSAYHDYLCRALNQWATRVAFEQSIGGDIVEPAGYDYPLDSPNKN